MTVKELSEFMENKNRLKVKKKVRKKNIRKEASRITLQEKCNNENKDKGLNLARFSYTDFVVMSSAIAYGIVDSVNQDDLGIILSFLGMITADIALLQTKSSIEKVRQSQVEQQNEEDIEDNVISDQISEEDFIDETLGVETAPFLTTNVLTTAGNDKSSKIKKRKRVKKIKRIRKK